MLLGYIEDGPDLILLVMNGWAEALPAWWLNLEAHPEAIVDLPGGQRPVRARVATDEERPRLWGKWADVGDDLDALAASIERETPLAILEPR